MKLGPRMHRISDRGQTTILVLLVLALFLLGFVGFAVDMTNMYFHRQSAQAAADAACQAGIMDVLLLAEGTPLPNAGFTPGTGFDCKNQSGATPCEYAALNGYSGTGLVAGVPSNQVLVSFPGSVPGVTPAPASMAPVPFLRVDIIDRIKLTFASLITNTPTSDVGASATCAVVNARAPIPIIVLNPTCSESLLDSGSGKISIIGGPKKSVQVNSGNLCATALSTSGCVTSSPSQCTSPPPPNPSCAPSNAAIDLTQAGPNFLGGTLGSFGGPNAWGGGFWTGPQGTWSSPASPIGDPYATLPEPSAAAAQAVRIIQSCATNAGAEHTDLYGVHGCPDHVNPCLHFRPGYYEIPIVVKGRTAIFDPGIYYIAPTSYTGACYSGIGNVCPTAACTDVGPITSCNADFVVAGGGVVRQSTTDFDNNGMQGTMFFLSSGVAGSYGSVAIVQNAGTYTAGSIDDYVPAGSATSYQAQCPGNPTTPNPPWPATIVGNVLLGPCTGTYGEVTVDPTTSAVDPIRGMLFFQDRANNLANGQANMQGGGGLLLAGTLYFHNCPNSPDCSPGYNTTYNGILQLQGNPGSQTSVVGEIITDSLNLSGNGSITMTLDPNRVRNVLKCTLVQ